MASLRRKIKKKSSPKFHQERKQKHLLQEKKLQGRLLCCQSSQKSVSFIINSTYLTYMQPYSYLISRVLNFSRQYFSRLYLRDFDRRKQKRDIKFRESLWNNILFSTTFETSQHKVHTVCIRQSAMFLLIFIAGNRTKCKLQLLILRLLFNNLIYELYTLFIRFIKNFMIQIFDQGI